MQSLIELKKQGNKKTPQQLLWSFLAVREGFEPSVQFNPYGSLANY